MKILHYIEMADVSFRVSWVDLLEELGRRGVTQAVLCRPGGNMERLVIERGIETHTWKPAITNFPPVNLQYPTILRRAKPDIVHTRLSSAANIAGYWGKKLGIPTIAMLDGRYKFKYYRNADHYTACCQWAKDHIVEQGVVSERVDVIYNPVDLARFTRDEDARRRFREERRIRPEERVFVSAGEFSYGKGFDILIRAFARVAVEHEDTRLLLAGDGEMRSKYEALIHEFGLEERVILSEGYVLDVRPWFWAADFFVLPSRGDVFPCVTLEGMGSGLPAIVTSQGGSPELITDRCDGLIVSPGDEQAMTGAMRQMLTMGEDAKREMKENMQRRMQRFSCETVASHLIEIYDRVLLNKEFVGAK